MEGFSFDAFDEFEYEEYEEIFVIEVSDLNKFILWMKKQTLSLTLYQVGKRFFNNTDFFKDRWDVPDDEDLSDADVLSEVFGYLVPNEEEDGKYFITTDDAEAVLGTLTNIYMYKILSKLVDMGVLQMCWNDDDQTVIWRVTPNKEEK